MKNATQCAKQLAALLKKLPTAEAPVFGPAGNAGPGDDPIAVLVQSFLLWETTTEKALAAYRRLFEHVVDYNDLRTSMPHEIAEYLGSRYPAANERSERLRAVLRDVYLREHDVTMASIEGAGKRDLRKYVESLDGIVPYVSARLMLIAFDKHATPVDEQLRGALARVGASDEDASIDDVANWLARQVKASDGRSAHFALQAWAESEKKPTTRKKTTPARKASAAKATPAKPAARKTSKKTTKTAKKPVTKKKTTTRGKTSSTRKKTTARKASK